MSKSQNRICFVLGGDRISGAEKRLIITAYGMAKNHGISIVLIINKILYSKLKRSSFYFNDFAEHVKLEDYSHQFSLNILDKTLPNLELVRLMRHYVKRDYILHVALYDRSILSSIGLTKVISKKSTCYFELTSPDVATSNITKLAVKFRFIVDGYISVSQSVTDKFTTKHSAVGSHFIRTRSFPFTGLPHLAGSDEIVNNQKENIVLYAHRLMHRKNPLLALDAAIQISKIHPNWRFIFCGTGCLHQELVDRLKLTNSSNIEILGQVSNIEGLLKKSKVFVSLIEPDNYPSQSLLEAIRHKNVLILSDTGYSKEKFFNNNGAVVKLSTESVSSALNRILSSSETETNNMAKNSFDLYSKRFASEHYFKECISLYVRSENSI